MLSKSYSVLILLLFLALFSQAAETDSVLAMVGEEMITSFGVRTLVAKQEKAIRQQYTGKELQERLAAIHRDALEHLIERELLYMDFKEMRGNIPTALIQERLENMILSVTGGNREEFEKILFDQEKLSLDQLKERIKKDIAIEMYRRERISKGLQITKDEIQAYYQDNKARFIQPRRFHIAVLLLKEQGKYAATLKETTAEITRQIKEGTPFGELVHKYSEGANAANGGDQGWMEKITPALLTVIDTMEPGQVHPDPVDLGSSLYFVKVIDVDGGGIPPLDDDLRKVIRNHLTKQEEAKRHAILMKELKQKYSVQIMNGLAN